MFYLAIFITSLLSALIYPFTSIYLPVGLLCLLLIIAVPLLRCRQLAICSVLVVILLAGLRGYSAHYPVYQLPAKMLQGYNVVVGTVLNIDKVSANNKQFDFKTKNSVLRLRWYFAPHYLIVGDKWQLTVKLKRPEINAGGFNKLYYFNANSIGAEGNVKFGHLLQKSMHNSLNYYRQYLAMTINKYISNQHLAAVLIALSTGTRAWLDSADWQVFKNTGTSHLIAISGLHIGLVYVAVLVLLQRILNFFPALFLYIPRQRLASIMALLLAFAYSLLAGWSWSTQRASWMLLLSVLVANTYRNCSRWQGLLFALWLIAILHPWALTQVGLYMSALSVASILWIMPRIMRKNFLLQSLYMQTAVFFILMPIMIAVFNNLTLLSWPANSIAIPWFSYLVLPLALAAVCLTPISLAIAKYFWFAAALLLKPIWLLLQWLSNYGDFILHPAVYGLLGLLSISVFSFAWLLCLSLSLRLMQLFFVLPLLVNTMPRLAAGGARFLIIVSKGQVAVLVQTPQHTLLYARHLLARYSGYRYILLPLLRSLHLNKITQVISYDFKAKRNLVAHNWRITDLKRAEFGVLQPNCLHFAPLIGMQIAKNGRSLDFVVRHNSNAQANNNGLELRIWRKAGNKAWHLSIYYQGHLDNYLLKHASSTRIDCRAEGGYKVYI